METYIEVVAGSPGQELFQSSLQSTFIMADPILISMHKDEFDWDRSKYPL
jgi:hypothetical protein